MNKNQKELENWCEKEGYTCYVNYGCHLDTTIKEFPILNKFISIGSNQCLSIVYSLVNDYIGKTIIDYRDKLTSKTINKILNEVKAKDGRVIKATEVDHSSRRTRKVSLLTTLMSLAKKE